MKKPTKTLAFGATLAAASLGLSACAPFKPKDNEIPAVYGPPTYIENEDASTEDENTAYSSEQDTGEAIDNPSKETP